MCGNVFILEVGAARIAPGLRVHAPKKSRSFVIASQRRLGLQPLNSSWEKLYKEGCDMGEFFTVDLS